MAIEDQLEEMELRLLSEIWRSEDHSLDLIFRLRRIEAKLDQILTEKRDVKEKSLSML